MEGPNGAFWIGVNGVDGDGDGDGYTTFFPLTFALWTAEIYLSEIRSL